MLPYMTRMEKMKYMTEMACKIVVSARCLYIEAVGDDEMDNGEDNAIEMEKQLEFLEKVVETVRASCRVLMAKRRGNVVDKEQLDISWNEIAEEVETIVENSTDTGESVSSASGSRKRGQPDSDDGKKGKKKKNTIGRLPAEKDDDGNASKGGNRKKQKVGKEDAVAAKEGGVVADNAVQEQGKDMRPKNTDVILDGVNEDAANRLLCHLKASHLAALWNSINRDTLRDHRLEENDSYARLVMGYPEPGPGDLESYFGDFTGDRVSFHEQIEWDKRIDKAPLEGRIEGREKNIYKTEGTHRAQNLVFNILSTMVQLKQAIDWNQKDGDWKTNYTNRRFEEEYKQRIAHMKAFSSAADFKRWLDSERKKFKDRQGKAITARNWTLRLYKKFGSIVLLDPRWNPDVYGKSNRSETFPKFLDYMDKYPVLKKIDPKLLPTYKGEIWEIDNESWGESHVGNRKGNRKMVLAVIRVITGDERVVEHVNEFISKKCDK
ncbi:hypothetical protein EYR40_008294 [Pleurotus pulmonarius]|nr:hypothetical protein EYR36_001852 [Pleurotus pulmonarius]KAF4565764.1 hypothetical protein EYR36_002342 [Pleurotus pulmonarius]KAF4569327.1 hypothetical protein EYR36_009117 [Pleurotus pulmonarius]KAF4583676.1 hypothetical protein EYR40_002167 [Pleurotus pulmonarius]KAF4588394.1 hypothetical protein EYR38_010362 [Pleurotus pulmonarius]